MMDNEQDREAVGPRLDRGVRPLREGEVMGAYMEFDRTADRAWTPAEYLVQFGLHVSRCTAEANRVPVPLPPAGDVELAEDTSAALGPNADMNGGPVGAASNLGGRGPSVR